MSKSLKFTTELQQLSGILTRLAPLTLLTVGFAFANIQPTFNPAGSETPAQAALCAGTTTCIVGTQDFSSWTGGAFTTDYGTSNQITGSYSGAFARSSADQYGGAGGSGAYPELFSNGPETLQLSTASGVPGVNYFGLWFSALDSGNLLQFYKGNNLLYSFTPATFIGLVGACNGSDPFCGNPSGAFKFFNPGQQYAYLNFFDTTGFFDKVVFTQTTGGGFESDNHAVGYINPIVPVGTAITPEPGFWSLSALGFAGLAAVTYRRRRRAGSANS